MCNACGNLCCGSDEFGGCGCDCEEQECWSDDDEDCEGGDWYDGIPDLQCKSCVSRPGAYVCEPC